MTKRLLGRLELQVIRDTETQQRKIVFRNQNGELLDPADNPELMATLAAGGVTQADLSAALATKANASSLAAKVDTAALNAAIASQHTVDNGTYARKQAWQGRIAKASGTVFPVMASPPTISALATATGITSPRQYNSLNGTGDVFPAEAWQYLGAQRPVRYGSSFPDFNYVKFQSFTAPSGSVVGHYSVEFYHYGTQVEFLHKGLAGAYQILVDDQLVQASAFNISNTGATNYQLITFGSAAVRKIRFRGYNIPFGGVNVGTLDAIWPTEKRGPRVVVLGDSLTGGTGSAASVLTSWASWMAETLGWYDVYHAYAGGSGLTVSGQGVTYANRVANDVIANSPDIVWIAGWHNDDGVATSSQIGTALAALLATIKAGLPNAAIIVSSSFWQRGPSIWPSGTLDARNAGKAATIAAGGTFLDILETPLNHTPATGTLSAAASANATTISASVRPAIGSTIQIGSTASGAGGDRRRVTAVSGAGPFTVTLNLGLGSAQASGTAWSEVGPPFVDGSGFVGATAGNGPSDVLCSSDGVHGTDAWHGAMGRVIGGLLTQQIGY